MSNVTEIREFNEDLEPEILTDKEVTKVVPCRECGRPCVVTTFATPAKTRCNTCRGGQRAAKREAVQIKAAHTVNPAALENLADGLINPVFKTIPLCPFDPEHNVELKSVSHSPQYGPRHLMGYDGKGIPQYDQQTGESVMYQCNDCRTVISYSTQHPLLLQAQNEIKKLAEAPSSLARIQGVRAA